MATRMAPWLEERHKRVDVLREQMLSAEGLRVEVLYGDLMFLFDHIEHLVTECRRLTVDDADRKMLEQFDYMTKTLLDVRDCVDGTTWNIPGPVMAQIIEVLKVVPVNRQLALDMQPETTPCI